MITAALKKHLVFSVMEIATTMKNAPEIWCAVTTTVQPRDSRGTEETIVAQSVSKYSRILIHSDDLKS